MLSTVRPALRIGHLGEEIPCVKDDRWSGFGGPERSWFPEELCTDNFGDRLLNLEIAVRPNSQGFHTGTDLKRILSLDVF
jgi:hypothetical protein